MPTVPVPSSLLRVRADDPEYRRVAAAEAAYWQNVLPGSLEDVEKHYRVGRNERYMNMRFTGEPRTHWTESIARWGTFRHGLVLGTSSLRYEARILVTNPGLHLVFVDLSVGAVARRADVLGKRFPGRVSTATADLNFLEIPAATYDLVVSSSTVHHVTNLEHLAFQVNRGLTAGGHFFLEDYVGEPRFLFSDAKKRLFDVVYHRDLAAQRGRKPGLVWLDASDLSPFCGVRSDEILDVFRVYLEEVQVRTAGTLSNAVMRSRPADYPFPVSPWKIRLARWRKRLGLQRADLLGKRFLDELFLVGDVASEAGIVRPSVAFAVYRKRG